MKPTRSRRPRVKLNRAAVSELLSLLNTTQTELAQLCGLSPGYFSLLMAGQRSPSPGARRLIQQGPGGERLRPAFHDGTRRRGRPRHGDASTLKRKRAAHMVKQRGDAAMWRPLRVYGPSGPRPPVLFAFLLGA